MALKRGSVQFCIKGLGSIIFDERDLSVLHRAPDLSLTLVFVGSGETDTQD